jgi:hypothetical protein
VLGFGSPKKVPGTRLDAYVPFRCHRERSRDAIVGGTPARAASERGNSRSPRSPRARLREPMVLPGAIMSPAKILQYLFT